MAQTDDGLSLVDADVSISTDGTSYTDISGFASSVRNSGGQRATGERQTFDGDAPIITPGKRGSTTFTVSTVYTEGATDPYAVVRGYHRSKTPVYLKVAPKGTTAGNYQIVTSPGYVLTCPPPSGEAANGETAMFDWQLKVSDWAWEAIV